MNAPALIVFAKPPEPGTVKTRLTALLTEEEAARLYEAFLRDALAMQERLAERHGAALRLYYAGAQWPERLTPAGAVVRRQRGDGLGARMATAFRDTFEAGATAALVTGTDHPTLPPAFVGQALDALGTTASEAGGEREPVCLGPSADGGYYLLGMRRFVPRLFEGMTYSHAGVFDQTLARAAEAGCQPVVLPAWYDVDRPADLRRLAAELAAQPGECAVHTRRQMRALLPAYPSLRPPPA